MNANQYMSDAQIRGLVADELRSMATKVVVDESRPVIRPTDIPDGAIAAGLKMEAFVSCLYPVTYRLIDPILCCVCGTPLTKAIEFRRFGKYPACSADCANTPVSRAIIS
jgi:hypothetical protein